MDISARSAPWLTRFSVERPWFVIALTLAVTVVFLTQLPRIKTDTDPKNMLPADSEVRVSNDQVERWFALHKDVIVLGIVSDRGVFNPETLARIGRITDGIVRIPGVVVRDVTSLTTVDDVRGEEGRLMVRPAVAEIPQTPDAMAALKDSLLSNPLMTDRLLSRDGTATAIYIPLEPGANARKIADRVQEILAKETGPEQFHLAGDPVARDTFGVRMFQQMGLFSPIAGMVMMVVLYGMFRNLILVFAVMGVAMVSVIWSMGLMIGVGLPAHIMSSMIPVFLMAIATDSIHIFNEFAFRFREVGDKRQAILDTIRAVARPVRYTALATAAGFGILIFMHIVPVKVFGLFVAFGTIVLRLMSFSLIPAVLALVPGERLQILSAGEDETGNRVSRGLRGLASLGERRHWGVAFAGLLLLTAAVAGIARIHVNNNMVDWFKPGSEIRIADRILNERLGGTSTAYVVGISTESDFWKQPEALRYLEGLQRELEGMEVVGKTFSVVDYVKRINRVLHQDDPAFDRVPDSTAEIAQYLFLFGMAAKPSDLDNVVDYPYEKTNLWVSLKTWDAQAMRDVMTRVRAYTEEHPFPGVSFKPAGIATFNLVWNDEVLQDMLRGFLLALVLVFIILVFNFRSLSWALVAYTPLLFTILLIYGAVGYLGKDFDMPISVLSTLSLGMAIDFAIHFVGRFRERYAEEPHVEKALLWTASRPGKGILRNAVLFAVAFSVMILAPLTPYITVGLFIVSMMLLSAVISLVGLPALITIFQKYLPLSSGKENAR
ncbi:MAG: MMPL family transporter [Nitrospirae bacterium]|nr:MMPL family transporter [Nitrospirota bacterium]